MRATIILPLLANLAIAACAGQAPVDAIDTAAADPAPRAEAAEWSVHDLPARWRDQDGAERTLASLGGRVQVVAMVYTTCAHTCPQIVGEMKRLEAALSAEERARTGFVLVSLDPERDGPAELAGFAKTFRLDPATWTLLTGDAGDVRELAALLGIRYRAEEDARISHSNTYLVLDPRGRPVHRQDGVGAGTAAPLASLRAAAAAR